LVVTVTVVVLRADVREDWLKLQATPMVDDGAGVEIPVPAIIGHLRLLIVTPVGTLKVTLAVLPVVAPEGIGPRMLPGLTMFVAAVRTVTGNWFDLTMEVVGSITVTVKV
jgi:hypothetical protein